MCALSVCICVYGFRLRFVSEHAARATRRGGAQYHQTVRTGRDIISIQRALEAYEDIDVNFAGSRESELLKVRRAACAPNPASRNTARACSSARSLVDHQVAGAYDTVQQTNARCPQSIRAV